MVPRTEQLLDFLDSQKTAIIVPMPCVAEYLCGVEDAQYGAVMQIFRERFIVQPFDALAAVATARLRMSNRNIGLEEAVRHETPGYPRSQVAVDHMIIGIAVSQKAEAIYTEDGPLKRFAEKHINVLGIPIQVPKQIPLEIQPPAAPPEP